MPPRPSALLPPPTPPQSQPPTPRPPAPRPDMSIRQSFRNRLAKCEKPLLRKLFQIIIDKHTNLCVSVNFKTIEETLKFIDKVGELICMLKIQLRSMDGGYSEEKMRLLYSKKKEYNFLIFADEKYCDTPSVVKSYYSREYVKYADVVSVMPIWGDQIFVAIEDAVLDADLPPDELRGCFAVCETTTAGYLNVEPEDLLEIAERHSSICIGIIAQNLILNDYSKMIKACPGIHKHHRIDGRGQKWEHPYQAIGRQKGDIAIVGRAITDLPEGQWHKATNDFNQIVWEAYMGSTF